MADTQRTRAEVLALFADNTTGNVSCQDLRDWVVTVMEDEFKYPGDFWSYPLPDSLTSDKITRGKHLYSQVMVSACSFGDVLYLTKSNTWGTADASTSVRTGYLAVATASYLAADSQCKLLLEGIVMNSGLSARLSGNIGRPLYLQSGGSGIASVTLPTNVVRLGIVLPNGVGDTYNGGKWFFKPEWSVVGT